jgi:hypothetical protein
MRALPCIAFAALILALGCSPAPQKVNSDPTAPPDLTVPSGAKPVEEGSKFLDGRKEIPGIKQADPTPQAASDEWVGTLEGGPDPENMTRDDRTGPPPLTQDLAEKLGGYRLAIDGARCTLRVTGITVEGACEWKGDTLVLTPEKVGGMGRAEAEKDPAFASLVQPFVFVKEKETLVVEFDGDRTLRFTPPSGKS